MRLLKQVLKNCFPNVGGAVTLSHTEINALPQDIADAIAEIGEELVPTGLIAMWSGSNAAIPSGWALCDGSNGTPNLRDRFIVGSGSTYATGNTGGADSKATSSNGDHNHDGNTGGHALTVAEVPDLNTLVVGGGADPETVVEGLTGTGNAHTHSISSDGAHTHTVDVRPKYYALAFIMKVAA